MLLNSHCDFELCMVHVGKLDYIWFGMIHKRGTADNDGERKKETEKADSNNTTDNSRLVWYIHNSHNYVFLCNISICAKAKKFCSQKRLQQAKDGSSGEMSAHHKWSTLVTKQRLAFVTTKDHTGLTIITQLGWVLMQVKHCPLTMKNTAYINLQLCSLFDGWHFIKVNYANKSG